MKEIDERETSILLAALDKEIDIKCIELQERQKEIWQKEVFFSSCIFILLIFLLQIFFIIFSINYILVILIYQLVALILVLPIIISLTKGGTSKWKKFEILISKINFKKAFKIYIYISVISLMLCSLAITYVIRDKIIVAFDYKRIAEAFERGGFSENIKTQLNRLSSNSKDIINVIVVDKDNNIIYRINSNLIGDNNKFTLVPYETNKKYLRDNFNKDVIYKPVKDENIIFNKNYIKNHEKIMSDIDDDLYYQQDLGTEKIDLINYLVNKGTMDKVFIIKTVNTIPYARKLVKIIVLIGGLIFTVYWIGLALWVYRDANRKKSNPGLWGLLTLVTNLVGLIIYMMYKQNSKICYGCGSLQSKENIYCTTCGIQINDKCEKCDSIVNKHDKYCKECGSKHLF